MYTKIIPFSMINKIIWIKNKKYGKIPTRQLRETSGIDKFP